MEIEWNKMEVAVSEHGVRVEIKMRQKWNNNGVKVK